VTSALLAFNERTFKSLRRHRNYRLFFLGQVVSVVGTWMQNIALAWLVVELTSSPIAVGALALFRFLPFMLFGLMAGVLADRIDNRRLVITTQASQMALSGVLALLVVTGTASLPVVYVLALLTGLALVADAPGRHSLVFRLVGREELPNAVALNASLFNASRVVGPSVAGVLIALFGTGVCFTVNTVSFVPVLAGLLLMCEEELVPVERPTEKPTFLRGTREALVYAWREPLLRTVLLVVCLLSTLGFNFHVVLPLLASARLDAGPEAFGILGASFGLGAVAGSLFSAAIGRASWKLFVGGTSLFSLGLLALAPAGNVPVAALLLVVVGFAFTSWSTAGNAILQLTAPDAMRGRLVGLYLFAFAGLVPLGSLLTGWLVDLGGTPLSFAVSGAACLAVTAWAVRARPVAAQAEARARATVPAPTATPNTELTVS
jgi:MFS family permease